MSCYVHATAVVWKETGILIIGESGNGKSSLAAELITCGATLIADDQVRLLHEDGHVFAQAPESLAGVLELRDVALISVPHISCYPIYLVVKLTNHESRTMNHALLSAISQITLPPHCADNAAKLTLYEQALQEGRVLEEDWKPSV